MGFQQRPLPISEQASRRKGLRQYRPQALALLLVALVGIIWWQHSRIQKLEGEQALSMRSYFIDAWRGFDSADVYLTSAIRLLKAGKMDEGLIDLHDALGYIRAAEQGAGRYDDMLYGLNQPGITIFSSMSIDAYSFDIRNLSSEISTAGSVSAAQMTALEDINYDLKLFAATLEPFVNEYNPAQITVQMNEATKGIKTQSVRQRLNLLPSLSGLESAGAGPDLPTISLESPTNCIMAGQPLTLTLEISNGQAQALTLAATPPIDIAISDSAGVVRERWSQSSAFPATIDSALQPGETRTYEWVWLASAKYGTPIKLQASANVAQFDHSVDLEIGVDALAYTDPEGSAQTIACQDL
jgi:hypothetical protein